ncbi:MAG: quinolinate synthase NadA [candidate division WOR-3 bacterium]
MNSNKDLVDKINRLRKAKNAIILAHNYQRPEVQDIADFVGDSLELAQKASAITSAEIIIFCGVHFMAETAKIVNPTKKVLMPDLDAGCPMADMITKDRLNIEKAKYPQARVVCYINSTADVKAGSYICCTSANAIKIVESLTDCEEILFIPDRYLGHYVSTRTNKKFHLYPGYCPTHSIISSQDIIQRKQEHPGAIALVHPECRSDVIAVADYVASTSGMCRLAKELDAQKIIIGTELGLIHRLKKENPDKVFIPANPWVVCPNMKANTLEKILWSLEDLKYEITVEEEIRQKAEMMINRMLEVSKPVFEDKK